MAGEFLLQMNLQDNEREKLSVLITAGSRTPFELLALYRASPQAFAMHLGGKERAAKIAIELETMLTPRERDQLAEEPPTFSTGALVDAPPER